MEDGLSGSRKEYEFWRTFCLPSTRTAVYVPAPPSLMYLRNYILYTTSRARDMAYRDGCVHTYTCWQAEGRMRL